MRAWHFARTAPKMRGFAGMTSAGSSMARAAVLSRTLGLPTCTAVQKVLDSTEVNLAQPYNLNSHPLARVDHPRHQGGNR